MSSPDFDDTFAVGYEIYSQSLQSSYVPAHFNYYVPSTNDGADFACRAIIQPAPERGAEVWTRGGKRILIGVYRDQGREASGGVDFYEDRVVYRLLPSFRLITIAELNALILETAPTQSRSIAYDPVSNAERATLSITLTGSNGSTGDFLNRQQFDETGKPLQQVYTNAGRPEPVKLRAIATRNARTMLSSKEGWTSKLPVVDYYGYFINDAARGPFNAADLITRGSGNTLIRRAQGGQAIYKGYVMDEFGLIAVGAQSDSTIIVRDPIMPIEVDNFNVPLQAPVQRAVNRVAVFRD